MEPRTGKSTRIPLADLETIFERYAEAAALGGPCCCACGGRERVRPAGGARFCADCLDHVEAAALPESWVELGVGD